MSAPTYPRLTYSTTRDGRVEDDHLRDALKHEIFEVKMGDSRSEEPESSPEEYHVMKWMWYEGCESYRAISGMWDSLTRKKPDNRFQYPLMLVYEIGRLFVDEPAPKWLTLTHGKRALFLMGSMMEKSQSVSPHTFFKAMSDADASHYQ
jgi:hypothetical protein